MTNNQPEIIANSEQERQFSIWSDLRAMKLISQMQQDIKDLEKSKNRLQLFLIITIIIFSVGLVGLGTVVSINSNQIQQLQELSIRN